MSSLTTDMNMIYLLLLISTLNKSSNALNPESFVNLCSIMINSVVHNKWEILSI